ncbi:PREDICTED: diacylglycerol kinase 5-like [Prunus mume]|uniref:Diacylglycerol kinase 5-like n=1 Tax=Prunus mume TaxID=102107 RepID=A0ABM0NTE5_PRUMU|nr:PREDICTED: diacylglycerol kinase 5-like [Prunus mume]
MRIIVVARDAIVNWILGVICDLKLPESPSIAPVPLRYHYNGIGASFGWKDISNISPLQSFLVDVALAESTRTDSWHCIIRMKRTQSSTGQPYASFMDPLPHCLHEVGDVEKADNPTFYGRFCYYFILRGLSYSMSDRPSIKVLNHLGHWEIYNHLPTNLNSICFLNLPIFDPSRNRGVTKNTMEDGKTPTNPSFIDDGRLEVVGSKSDFWYGGIDWPLLDQVRGVRFEFIEGARGVVHLRIDEGMSFGIRIEELVEIEISYHGQVNILALPDCAAKSIRLSTQSSVSQANAKD